MDLADRLLNVMQGMTGPLAAGFMALSIALDCSGAQAEGIGGGNLIVGVETIRHYPYYGMCGDNFCGFARDIFDAFAKDNHFTITYLPLPITRLHRALAEGRVDLKFPANPDWAPAIKQGHSITYSQPVVDFVDGVMTLADKSATIDSLGALGSLGTIRGFTLDLSKFRNADAIKLYEASSEDDLMNMLFRGRVDGIYSNITVVQQAARENNLAQNLLIFRRDLPYQHSQYYASTGTRPLLVTAFNAWMTSHPLEMNSLKTKYGLTDISSVYFFSDRDKEGEHGSGNQPEPQ